MNAKQTIAWFEEIAAKKITLHPRQVTVGAAGSIKAERYELREAGAWFTEAQSALESVCPAEHAVRKRWEAAIIADQQDPRGMASPKLIDTARSIFDSALSQLKTGRLRTLVTGIQAETISELLDQAALLAKDYGLAATVIAGGALETHLLHLCKLHGISWQGAGSISAYNDAIAQDRNNTGREIYSAAYGKQITAWGGYRNVAAHQPTTFTLTADDVRRIIDGARQFVAQTS